MEMLDMPTRSEVDESHLRVHELRKEVKALKMQMKEMQAAVAALSAQGSAPEKRSTRKKGA
jgi:hypothetical protein